jgi:hypothetical protein
MRIASGPSVISVPSVRTETARSLAAGEQVFISPASAAEAAKPAQYPADVQRHIEAGRAIVSGVWVTDPTLRKLDVGGAMFGGALGMVGGAAVGVIVDQIRAAHPTSAIAFDAAFAALGSTMGAAVGSGLFTITEINDSARRAVRVDVAICDDSA